MEVEQRDLYDRAPELKWSQRNVCLLGDAAHPMMPNLGQGGCMAIEDALVLGQELRRIGDFTSPPPRHQPLRAEPRPPRLRRAGHVPPLLRLPLPVEPPDGRAVVVTPPTQERRPAL